MEHTPGPWIVFSADGYSEVLPAMREGHIATAIPNVADADLIAAAPDLLHALRLILPLAKGYAPAGQTATARRTCDEWISAAATALAKAELTP